MDVDVVIVLFIALLIIILMVLFIIEKNKETKTDNEKQKPPIITPLSHQDAEKLQTLKGLLDDEILTQEEFHKEKQKILNNE